MSVAGANFGRGYLLNPHEVVLVRDRMEEHRRVERDGVALRALAEEYGMELGTVREEAEGAGAAVTTVLATQVLAPTKFITKAMEGAVRAGSSGAWSGPRAR